MKINNFLKNITTYHKFYDKSIALPKFLFVVVTIILFLYVTTEIVTQQADPRTALEFFERGGTYIKKGDLDNALANYTQAICINSNLAEVYYS